MKVPEEFNQTQVAEGAMLARSLKGRHIQLIAIGVGLFLGSGQAIRSAGPALLMSYAVGGAAVFFIMRGLSLAAQAFAGLLRLDRHSAKSRADHMSFRGFFFASPRDSRSTTRC
jgi:L-asparagine transporter-like permease